MWQARSFHLYCHCCQVAAQRLHQISVQDLPQGCLRQALPIKDQMQRTEYHFRGSCCLSGDDRIVLFRYQIQSRQSLPVHDCRV